MNHRIIYAVIHSLTLLLINKSTCLAENNTKNSNITFPTTKEAIELNRLSKTVYKAQRMKCPKINTLLPENVTCYFNDWNRVGTEAMVVTYSQNKTGYIAVLFAGTDEKRDFLIDANIQLVPFGNKTVAIDEDILVHEGFNTGLFFDDLPWKLLDEIISLREQFPSYKLYVSGHSLGAAISQLFSFFFTYYLPNEHIINLSYGCPKVGGVEWVRHFNNSTQISSWRYVHHNDVVARAWVGPRFFHAGHTFQLNDQIARVYYLHYGNDELGYSGVPDAWYVRGDTHNVSHGVHDHYLDNYYAYLVNKSIVDPVRYYPNWFTTTTTTRSNNDNIVDTKGTIVTKSSASMMIKLSGFSISYVATTTTSMLITLLFF